MNEEIIKEQIGKIMCDGYKERCGQCKMNVGCESHCVIDEDVNKIYEFIVDNFVFKKYN